MKMPKKKIDWEQRRYELAKILLPKVLELEATEGTTINELVSCYAEEEENWPQSLASVTIQLVDELLHRLKNNELNLDRHD